VANAATYDIAAVNMSLGDTGNYDTPQMLYGIDDELAALAALDVMVVSASGNGFYTSGSTQGVGYPAADPNSLSIGAVYDANTGGWSYSSGAVAYSSGADRLTPFSQRSTTLTSVFAPGAVITGADASGGTVAFHGTSQASPHIAGIAALCEQLAVNTIGRRLTLAEFEDLLQTTGVTITDGDDEDDNVTNTGLSWPRVDMLALGNAILALAETGAHTVILDPGEVVTNVDFGNRLLDATPPQIVGWQSARTHGATVGEQLLEIPDDGSFSESRYDGISRLVVTFDEAVDPATFTASSVQVAGNDVDNNPVDLSGVTISTSMVSGDTVGIIDFSPALPDYARYVVRLDGIQDVAGNPLAGDNDRVMTSLVGDANGDLRVNNTDMAWVRYYRDLPANPIDPGDAMQLRTDIWPDGRVNNTDMAWVRYYRDEGRDARGMLDPVLSGQSGSIVSEPGRSGMRGTPGVGQLHRNNTNLESTLTVSLGLSGSLGALEPAGGGVLTAPLAGLSVHRYPGMLAVVPMFLGGPAGGGQGISTGLISGLGILRGRPAAASSRVWDEFGFVAGDLVAETA